MNLGRHRLELIAKKDLVAQRLESLRFGHPLPLHLVLELSEVPSSEHLIIDIEYNKHTSVKHPLFGYILQPHKEIGEDPLVALKPSRGLCVVVHHLQFGVEVFDSGSDDCIDDHWKNVIHRGYLLFPPVELVAAHLNRAVVLLNHPQFLSQRQVQVQSR